MLNEMEQNLLIEKLDSIIRHAVPNVVTVPKYGGTLYTLKPEEKEGQFCGVFAYKNHVQLAFSQGTALKDPRQVLIGTGKFRRHLNVATSEDIDPDVVSELIKDAVTLSLLQET